ncbi:MAG: hypothetical protein AAGB31_16250 [Bdellovibrio sp.]
MAAKKFNPQISAWIEKFSELEQESPRKAYEHFTKEHATAKQAFTEGIDTQVYDLENTLIRVLLETDHFTEAASFLTGQNEFQHKTLPSTFQQILEEVFYNVYQFEEWRETALGMINLAKKDSEMKHMTGYMEIDYDLYGDATAFKKALQKIDTVIAQTDVLHFERHGKPVHLAMKACIAAAIREDYKAAGLYLEKMISLDPAYISELKKTIQDDERLEDFQQSAVFKQAQQALPSEKHLAAAYEQALNEPYQTYQKLEKKKKDTKDTADLLSVQHYCIALICSDLEEHGEDNMEDYGKGKISVKEFKSIKKDLESQLKATMTKTKIKQTNFWKFKGFKSFKDIPF